MSLTIYRGKHGTRYGYRRGDGSIDLFNRDSTRRATITPGIAGQPPRVTVPKGRR